MYNEDMRIVANLYSGILCSLGGLVWHGLSNFFPNVFWFATTQKELAHTGSYGAAFVYVPEIDTENFLEPCCYNPKILIPTEERSIVLYQRDEAIVPWDDEQLMISMQRYDSVYNGDTTKLLEVADFYNRRTEILKSWEISKDFDSEYSDFAGW